MTYKNIRKELKRIEPYFVETAKEVYDKLDFSNKQYLGHIENILYENNEGVNEYYIMRLFDKLKEKLYPQMTYKFEYDKHWLDASEYLDIKYLVINWNDVEIYRVPEDDIIAEKHSIKDIARIILYILCCVQQRCAIKNIVKYHSFDKY